MSGTAAQSPPNLPAVRLPVKRLRVKEAASFLDEWSEARLVFFSGKGGVGKTTMATAAGIAIARRSSPNDCRVLILSVDPAHSLADSLGQSVGARAVPVQNEEGLWAMELDAASLADAFTRENAEFLRTLLDRGSLLDRSDINGFLDLTLPGVDEVMAVVEIAKLLDEGEWNLILVDTAPTGHALSFLAMPGEMKCWIKALDVMQSKHRYLTRHFGRGGHVSTDAAEQFLVNWNRKIERARELFAARDRAEFVPVTTPESMALVETERLLQQLADMGIHPKRLIVNQLIEPGECVFCTSRNRQQLLVLAAASALSHLEWLPIPLFAGEVHGEQGLNRVVRTLERLAVKGVTFHDFVQSIPKEGDAARPVRCEQGEPLVLQEGVRFTFFGGKGGVGKTSLAATTALRLAATNPDRRVLLFSTDPAHSLTDCLGVSVGTTIVPVAPDNLFACEQDAQVLFKRFRERYGDSIAGIFDSLTSSGNVQVQFEKESVQQLASLSPPGVAEIMFLKSVMDLMDSGEYDLFVLDTAPTGHALRFLELPELAHAWLRAIFKTLLKYGRTVCEEMVNLARSLRRFQAVLTDPAQAEFVVVTLAEEMAVRESERLLEHLSQLHVGCHSVVFNKVIPESRCSFCASTRKVQKKYMANFRKTHPDLHIVSLPMFPQPIVGLGTLRGMEPVLFNGEKKA